MILRFVILLFVACLCHGPVASAADVPFSIVNMPAPAKPVVKQKKKAAQPASLYVARKSSIKPVPESQEAVIAPKAGELELSWVLDPLVANADGSKTEGSASAEANLVVTEPDFAASPSVTIELFGHIVKTVDTTARIDVHIGKIHHKLSWASDDVQAGRFSTAFKATLPDGNLPPYFPVSAIALVTNDGENCAVMVSLEKIVVRIGNVVVAQSQ